MSPSTATESDSISSLVTALSHADDTARESALLFSPKSARTTGTGATGSTEPPGEATRSLVGSVEARSGAPSLDEAYSVRGDDDERASEEEAPHSEDESVARSRAASGDTDWTHLSELRRSLEQATSERERAHLAAPEPEQPLLAASSNEPASVLGPALKLDVEDHDDLASHVKLESDDGHFPSASAPALSPSSTPSPPSSRHATPTNGALTDSQEDALLAQSVTRSQSDFSHWLEETMRLARGDGSSTIESDDALSSIIEATRHVQLGWTALSQDRSVESWSERGDGGAALPDEDLTLTTVRTRETVVEGVEEDVVVLEGAQEAAEEIQNNNSLDHPARPAPSSARPWQLLSIALAAALACTLRPQPFRPASHEVALEPTRSLRYVPLNETAQVSHFATPIPIGSSVTLPVVALLATLLVGASASVPLLLHRRARAAARPECVARSRSATPPSPVAVRRFDRATSPLLELNGDALLRARELLPMGIEHYTSSRLTDAAATFVEIVSLACAPADKGLASEWLGRTLYRLARTGGSNREALERAAAAFERAIRLDGGRATPRASLGRVKFRLGDYEGAVAALRAALKRDEQLAFAHEYLAKAVLRVEPRPADAAAVIEQHLGRAIALDPLSYTALAALGEYLHLSGGPARLAEARTLLERAVALRADYPAAHARLAMLANETLDAPRAAAHYAALLATRHTGLRDRDALRTSERACDGSAPFLGWCFVTRPGSAERRVVLERAVSEHSHDELVRVLHAVEAASSSSSVPAAALLLEEREAVLARRAERSTISDDPTTHGLWALALLALGGAARTDEAQRNWAAFWEEVVAGRGGAGRGAELDKEVGFLAMAYYEVQRGKEEEAAAAQGQDAPRVRARAVGRKGAAKAQAGKGVSPRKTSRKVKREQDVEPVVVAEVVEPVPLRRSPRKQIKA
ncbi:hypothetical protein JCM3775_006115 [Rhodotorula graminis]|uniref:Uncharacterized protein n=1 Tax=Rhodotorula graminis (strain WP1) TaxID=578459 RepID=A0A194S1U0_RHOGW|nr:uncharacterized protein RHOBADRAFT_54294 [Rhodotorula graminis WP1]KPV74479.1 hypothetical protein RHOBADRAFT_54294 [Rhodotorula graminis WP1]